MKYLSLVVFFLLYSLVPGMSQSESDSTKWEIVTKDGNIYTGLIKSKSQKRIFLKTENLGTIAIKTRDISSKSRLVSGQDKSGISFRPNYFPNRYMLMPTGILNGSSKGYYENKYVFVNHFNLNISKNFSLGVGIMPIFLFDENPLPLWVTPKFRIPVKMKNLEISVGAFYGRFLFDQYFDDYQYFYGYGMATYGTPNINVSFGVGFGYWEHDWENSPALAFGANVRVSRTVFLFTENILFRTSPPEYVGDPTAMVTLGARSMWRNISLDFGVLHIKDDDPDYFFVVPYLGLMVPFK